MANDQAAKARDAAARALATGNGRAAPRSADPNRPAPRRSSTARVAFGKSVQVVSAVLSAANKALSAVEFFSELVAAKGPLTRTVQPTPYQSHHQGPHGSHELGHYAPEADPTSPYAIGHPQGAGFAHGPQTGHTYQPGRGM